MLRPQDLNRAALENEVVPGRTSRATMRWVIRVLALSCVLLALMCLALAVAWSRKAGEAACYREALAEGATPAVADFDCTDDRSDRPL